MFNIRIIKVICLGEGKCKYLCYFYNNVNVVFNVMFFCFNRFFIIVFLSLDNDLKFCLKLMYLSEFK